MGTETSTAQSPAQRSGEAPLDRPTATTKMMMKKLATVGLIGLGLVSAPNAVFGRSLLQEEASDLPLGMTEGQLAEEMELDCVMKNEAFASLFQNMLASNGIDESSPMHAVAKQAPAIAGGYYACGGRIKPVLEFVEGVAPGMLGGGGFDPMSVLAAPEFMALQASGFDMACFFGVPEVS